METNELPAGWVTATVDDLGEYINGCAFKPADWHETGTPIVRIQNLTDPSKPLNLTERKVDERYHIDRRDILVSWSATLDVFRWSGPLAYVNQHIFKVVPSDKLDGGFVEFSLKKAILELTNSEHLHGSTMKHINRRPFLAHSINLPPLPEQERIVEKIEMLFAELGKGEEALREVQKLLARYRQSVLKDAFAGKLTADWRYANGADDEIDLLETLLQQRRKTWEGRGKYEEPSAPDSDRLSALPEGWVWTTIGQLFHVFGGATPSRRKPENWNGEIPWVSSGEVAFCRIKSTREKITDVGLKSCSTKIHPIGTVLLAMIGEGKTRGQAAILDIPAGNNQNAAAIRVSQSTLPAEYVYYFLLGNYEESRLKGQGGNQPALNGEKVKSFLLPLPISVNEAQEIVSRIEEAFASSEIAKSMCEAELLRSKALRQSILKDAFSGKLVPQDPSDEPAEKLLERIRASRLEGAKSKTKRVEV